MAKFTFLLILAAVAYIGYHLYGKKLIRQGPAAWIKPAIVLLIALLLLAVATGRANAIFAVIGAAVAAAWRMAPILLRFAPQLSGLFKRFSSGGAQTTTSKVQTTSLEMTLNHNSGEFDGIITQGALKSRHLSSLSRSEFQQFAGYCQQHDPEGLKLLHSFVSRYHPDWEFEAHANAQINENVMSTEEALSILGLDSDASSEDIIVAHRRLMSKLHPDKGGNDYLATKINQAKKHLIKKNGQPT